MPPVFINMKITQTFLLTALIGWSTLLSAAIIQVAPGELPARLAEAQDGDHLHLLAGEHIGSIVIERSIRLTAEPDAVVDGEGTGSILTVKAPDVTVDGLTLRNAGRLIAELEAGIFVGRNADNARILNNRIYARAFGIWLDSSKDSWLEGNHISGDVSLRSQDRGNGLHLFNVSKATVKNNRVELTRDGIYMDASNNNRLIGNQLHDQRYGVHYMFSHFNEIAGNRTWGNRTGFALMASHTLHVHGNHADGDQSYGFLLNDLKNSTIENNTALNIDHGTSPGTDVRITGAEGKALFLYNANSNVIRDNLMANTAIGVHLTAGSSNNRIYRNNLVNNRSQVMYVATGGSEWSHDGQGNFWTDYVGWDMDSDGIGDVAHEPNDAVDRLLWTYPMARVLMNSPAVQLLRWVQRAFPVLRPPGVKDSFPLMRPTRSLEEVS